MEDIKQLTSLLLILKVEPELGFLSVNLLSLIDLFTKSSKSNQNTLPIKFIATWSVPGVWTPFLNIGFSMYVILNFVDPKPLHLVFVSQIFTSNKTKITQ